MCFYHSYTITSGYRYIDRRGDNRRWENIMWYLRYIDRARLHFDFVNTKVNDALTFFGIKSITMPSSEVDSDAVRFRLFIMMLLLSSLSGGDDEPDDQDALLLPGLEPYFHWRSVGGNNHRWGWQEKIDVCRILTLRRVWGSGQLEEDQSCITVVHWAAVLCIHELLLRIWRTTFSRSGRELRENIRISFIVKKRDAFREWMMLSSLHWRCHSRFDATIDKVHAVFYS